MSEPGEAAWLRRTERLIVTDTPRVQRLEVGLRPEIDDPRGQAACRAARDHLGLPVDRILTRRVFKLDFALTADELERVREALTDPVTECSAVSALPLPDGCDWVVTVGYRPGVTDNVGRTARVFVRDLIGAAGRELDGEVYGEVLYLVHGPDLRQQDVERLARDLLANELIERIAVRSAAHHAALAPHDLALPVAGSTSVPRSDPVALPDDDQALLALSRSRTLSLNLAELRAIRDHYASAAVRGHRAARGLPADPTDAELEALAQTWSEHCKHKIFNARIRYLDRTAPGTGDPEVIDSLFATFIAGSTRRIAERVDWLVSVFDDNAGVVRIDDDTHLVYKVETHNSPSALDPVGGAMTGIVGVNRDPFGTGLGAALLTNVWGYCLGPPDHHRPLPRGLLHPRRIRDGVHRGVIEGGNQSGIPYSRGWELFDERFVGKPLVFCGTVGVMPARIQGRPSESKVVEDGDLVVMVGGRIGKDGIHGATFSSEALHDQSPAQAVQIGDPITQKMMTDMLLEARDRGLYRAITDNGAGGLSSSVGEMARLVGGAEIDLALAPLKYPGLMPWEILLSEAQERMTLAVPPARLNALLELARQREVEATALGRFRASGRFEVRFGEQLVADLDMGFLHNGCPQLELEAIWDGVQGCEPPVPDPGQKPENIEQLLIDIIGDFNFCSKERSARQYDHEVKGLSVIKPLCGVRADVPADATVMRVAHGRDQAIVLSEAVAPRLADIDGRVMAAYVVDLAVRRTVAAGGRLGAIAGLDNFCWPDPVQSEQTPDGHRKLATLVRCCQGLAELTEALSVPLISGKDSMKNDAVMDGIKISIPPTLLLSTLGWIPDASRALDLTIPAPNHALYVLGVTGDHLGGSELHALLRRCSGRGPEVLAGRSRAVCEAAQAAIEAGHVSAAHAPHLGGLGAALATLCLASDLGLEIKLDPLPVAPGANALPPLTLLFSESASRLLLAAPEDRVDDLEALLASHHDLPWARIGTTTADASPRLRISCCGLTQVDLAVADLRASFRRRGL